MFKKALIIIAAVFVGLIGLAVVGSFISQDEPQKVVIVTETETPTPEPAQELESLTAEEQEVYDFVLANYPKAQELFENTCAVTDKESTDDGLADIEEIVDDATAFTKIAGPWADLDYQGGSVSQLERAFETYMVAVRTYYKNWLNGIDGGNVAACATRAVKAEVKAENWAPKVEDELEAIEAEYTVY